MTCFQTEEEGDEDEDEEEDGEAEAESEITRRFLGAMGRIVGGRKEAANPTVAISPSLSLSLSLSQRKKTQK
jgi:hypothetical protein